MIAWMAVTTTATCLALPQTDLAEVMVVAALTEMMVTSSPEAMATAMEAAWWVVQCLVVSR